MAEIRNAYKMLSINLKGRDHLGQIREGGIIILNWILKDTGSHTWAVVNRAANCRVL